MERFLRANVKLLQKCILWKDIIPNADSQTFKVLSIIFSKDRSDAYFKGSPIPNADSQYFKVIYGYLAKDINHVYYGNKVISTNQDEFKILSNNYMKDDKTVWFVRIFIYCNNLNFDLYFTGQS